MFDKTEEVLGLAKNGNYKIIESLLYTSVQCAGTCLTRITY